MSIEAFWQEFDAGDYAREGEQSGDTLARFLLDMRNVSREQIVSLVPRESHDAPGIDPEDVMRISRDGGNALSAIYLAGIIPEFHEVLATRRLNVGSIFARINEGVIGTIVKSLKLKDEDKDKGGIEVSEKEWRKMIEEFKRNNTFAGFLRDPGLLPEELRIFLQNKTGLLRVAGLCLGDYERTAKLLLGDNTKP